MNRSSTPSLLTPVSATETDQAWDAAATHIRAARRILLICHVSPDGDAIGSMLGLGLALQSQGKAVTMACQDRPPDKFRFLPGFDAITNAPDAPSYDLVIGLDSSDQGRLGKVYAPEQLGGIPLINLDHHITNTRYADINIIDHRAASTAELVLTLLDHLRIPPDAAPTETDRDIATCLLTGIVTDTVGFRTASVTPAVMAAVVRLMQAGASLAQVTHHSFNQRPLAELALLARGLNRLHAKDGLAWSQITLADHQALGTDTTDAGLAGMLVRTREVHISVVFIEKENQQVEISFRADPGFDVSQVALQLGGGGHPAASGCTVEGSLESAKARVLPMLRAALQEQRQR